MKEEHPWVDMKLEDLHETFGKHWRQIPTVYLSCSLSGDRAERDRIKADHDRIICGLAPVARGLSPLRGLGDNVPMRPLERLAYTDTVCLLDTEILHRDIRDVTNSAAVLLDLRASLRTVKLNEDIRTHGLRPCDEATAISSYSSPTPYEIQTEAPMTGSVIEIYEAWKHRVPVIGYNAHIAARQANSPWFSAWVTRSFDDVIDAIAYIKKQWLV